jgi:hypothetical protein
VVPGHIPVLELNTSGWLARLVGTLGPGPIVRSRVDLTNPDAELKVDGMG